MYDIEAPMLHVATSHGPWPGWPSLLLCYMMLPPYL